MTTDSIVVAFQHPDDVDDPLTSILRDGARRLLAQAVEAVERRAIRTPFWSGPLGPDTIRRRLKRVDQDATGATITMRAKRRCRIAGRA